MSPNPLVAGQLIMPIDGTAAAPSLSIGGSETSNSGTGMYGTYGSIKMSLNGTLALTLDATSGLAIAPPAGNIVLTSTVGALILPKMTTTQRNALTAVKGMIIYNTSTDAFNVYDGAWKAVTAV